jgi:hypothetical protein
VEEALFARRGGEGLNLSDSEVLAIVRNGGLLFSGKFWEVNFCRGSRFEGDTHTDNLGFF